MFLKCPKYQVTKGTGKTLIQSKNKPVDFKVIYYQSFTDMISDSILQHFKNLTVKVDLVSKILLSISFFQLHISIRLIFFLYCKQNSTQKHSESRIMRFMVNLSSIKTHIKKIYKNATLLNDLFWKNIIIYHKNVIYICNQFMIVMFK